MIRCQERCYLCKIRPVHWSYGSPLGHVVGRGTVPACLTCWSQRNGDLPVEIRLEPPLPAGMVLPPNTIAVCHPRDIEILLMLAELLYRRQKISLEIQDHSEWGFYALRCADGRQVPLLRLEAILLRGKAEVTVEDQRDLADSSKPLLRR